MSEEPDKRVGMTTAIVFAYCKGENVHSWENRLLTVRATDDADAEKTLLVKLQALQDYASRLGLWLDYNKEIGIYHEDL